MIRNCLTIFFVCLSISCWCPFPLQSQENETQSTPSKVQSDGLDVEFDLGTMEEEFESGNVDELTPEQEQKVKVWRFTLRSIGALVCVGLVVLIVRFIKRRKKPSA